MTQKELDQLKAWLANATREEREEMFSKLSPGQMEDIKYNWGLYARDKQRLPEIDGSWNILMICAGRMFGKLLSKDEEILTLNKSWTTIGEIEIGDTVFDETGTPCKVTNYLESEPRRSFKITFESGEEITACADHLWSVHDKSLRRKFFEKDDLPNYPINWATSSTTRYKGSSNKSFQENNCITINTEQMFEGIKKFNKQYSIPLTFPLKYGEEKLPLDPKYLGLWLADGTSNSTKIESADPEIIFDLLQRNPKWIMKDRDNGKSKSRSYIFYGEESEFDDNGRLRNNTNCIKNSLTNLNVLNNKHIPRIYMEASYQQRLDLLIGAMDGDGSIRNKSLQCMFHNTNENLAKDIFELVSSLGLRPTFRTYEASTLYDRNNAKNYIVAWNLRNFIPFSITRKVLKCKKSIKKKTGRALNHRMIVDIEEVDNPSCGMRCLSVDSPSNLFLITRSFIPTHNTRAASEMIRELVCGDTPEAAGRYSRVGLVGINEKSVRDVMVTGKSGILAVHPEAFRPRYISGQAQLQWPNGAVATMYNSYASENLRGPEFDVVWGDEIAAWKKPKDVYNQIRLSTRIKPNPIQIYTTTPKPIPLMKEIINRKRTITITGSSYENSDNIAEDTLADLEDELGGSRFGRQELHAEILEDVEGALWNWSMIARTQRPNLEKVPCRVVIGVDPSGGKSGDAVGIVVAAKTYDKPYTYYVLEDATFHATPNEWGLKVAMLYEKWEADKISIESNFGGALVEEVMNGIDPSIPVKYVKASKGKMIRGEPISMLYEKDMVYHCGEFKTLEEEMTTFANLPGQKSPNSMDALVWALTELKGKARNSGLMEKAYDFKISGFYD